ncbi:MFS transporter [Streptomyces coelicoflavus]|uniref:MFS transporter n=1 Tax=Streptomyces coelicoflavus TaxID=285562 RepID=A0A6N9UQ55_9ACTN|nr:MFS transporter [Streptomyces coelicoflavus]
MSGAFAAGPGSRALLTGYFLGLGMIMAVWGARMPAVQEAAHLGTGGLALVLLAAAVGMVAGLQIGGRCTRPARLPALLTAGSISLAGCLVLLGQSESLSTLLTAAVAFGLAHGVLDVAANTAAVRCQNAMGRPIMSGLHAAYSLGALAGAALAATTAHTPHSILFTTTGVLLACAAVAAVQATRSLSGTDHHSTARDGADSHEERPLLPSPGRLWLLAALAAASLLGEGAAADWAVVHLHALGAPTAASALAFALYSAAMAAGRLTGDRLTAAFGAPTVVRAGAVLAAAGLTIGATGTSTPLALTGWALFGLGLSTTVPSLITAAGAGGARAVARVTATGYLGLLAGPALIGALASATTLSTALLLPAALAAAVAVLAHRALENTTP